MTDQCIDWNRLSLDELFESLVDASALSELISTAKREDMSETGDITSNSIVPADVSSRASFRARQPGVVAGVRLLPLIAAVYDDRLSIETELPDGSPLTAGDTIATVSGPLRSVLSAERVMLNFMTHLSGIASLTRTYVNTVQGTAAKIYDTRKTIPGLRTLAKYAVRCGGGYCHRIGLYDAVLIKDNHLVAIQGHDWIDRLSYAIEQARDGSPSFVEVEVDSLQQLDQVLGCTVDMILLDNMGPDHLRQAVAMRNATNPSIELEASGGVNLDSVLDIARSGVDRIAIGALTHSASSLDIGLDIPLDQ